MFYTYVLYVLHYIIYKILKQFVIKLALNLYNLKYGYIKYPYLCMLSLHIDFDVKSNQLCIN